MDRRDLFKKLSLVPFFPMVLKEYEKPDVITVPPKPPFDSIQACGWSLLPGIMRCAIDSWGDDCDVVGHPAQKYAWTETRLIIGNTAYGKEFNEQLCDYLMGTKFRADYGMPLDRIEFRRNGKVMGWISQLALPVHYNGYRDGK